MVDGPACKLFQKKLYSWLSSRKGLPLCILGLMALAISAFQFGEVALEWSKERYAAQFSIYHDNIAGKSFEKYMAPELPIDVVYTWVNGSDPHLIKELKNLKQKIANEKEAKVSSKETEEASSLPPVTKCPFTNCYPWKTLIADAFNLSSTLSLASFQNLFPFLKLDVKELHYLHHSSHPAYAIKMESEDKVTSYLKSPIVITSNGLNVSLTRGFITSDASLIGSIPLPRYIMATSPRLLPGNTTIHHLLTTALEKLTSGRILEVEVLTRGVGIASVDKGNWDGAWSKNVTFLNETLKLHSVNAIWIPMNEQYFGKTKSNDDISQNRFQDNEELRYSLRSVEKFAPWVRHIYIVTNGQIPYWLNLDNPRVSIVTHQEIYLNKSHLPSYSSPSIESHLHRIPGLSKWFLYLNDDVMFGQDVWPHDFFTPDGGQKVYLSWAVPNCAEGCPSNWIRDRYCDAACNVSTCDWDGGDCINATRPGRGIGSNSWSPSRLSTDYCNTGCLNTWVGDRYCDNACNNPTCGYDAGDCGTDKLDTIYSINILPDTLINTTFTIPLDTTAMFFNMSTIFDNVTITSASHSQSKLIRTAVIAKQLKILFITFSRNVSQTSCYFSINSPSSKFSFILVGDTMNTNKSASKGPDDEWSFPKYNNSNEQEFLHAVSVKIKDIDSSINSWITERPFYEQPTVQSSVLTNYTISNISILPINVAQQYLSLQKEYDNGDLTLQGFLKKQAVLLQPFSHLDGIELIQVRNNINTTVQSLVTGIPHHPSYVRSELSHKRNATQRRLLSNTDFPSSWLPWERYGIFPPGDSGYETIGYKGRRLLDTFADSLRYVNVLYTKEYGHHSRKVPAHMPHMINKFIMKDLQSKYEKQFDITSSHKLRSTNDMQFAFSYFYYVMSEKKTVPIEEVFSKLDTDNSGILSVRELRTLLVKLMDTPLTSQKIGDFEEMLKQCNSLYSMPTPSIDPIEFETHYDPDLPLITLDFMKNCSALMDKINKTYSLKNKYSFVELGEEQVQFKMLVHNSSKILTKLDEVRKDQRKFICLNDNIDHASEDSVVARVLLQDFYESLFPIPSQFELPLHYRNKFMYTEELHEWLATRWKAQLFFQSICAVLILLCVFSLFYGKIIQWKRKVLRFLTNCFRGNVPRRISTV